MRHGGHLLLDVVQLDVGIDGCEALAHRRQIDVLVMRMGDHERPVNAKAKRAPHHITCPVHNLGGANHEGACLLLQGQLELVVDQLDGDAQVVMFVALLLEGVLHLAELLLQATALHHLCLELVVETYPSHIPTMSKRLTMDS